jgi:hypothetical protein
MPAWCTLQLPKWVRENLLRGPGGIRPSRSYSTLKPLSLTYFQTQHKIQPQKPATKSISTSSSYLLFLHFCTWIMGTFYEMIWNEGGYGSQGTSNNKGVCHTAALPFTLKSILRQKKNDGNSNTPPSKNIHLQKNPLKETKILQDRAQLWRINEYINVPWKILLKIQYVPPP